MSRYSKPSAKDPALTVGYGWDKPVQSYFAWVGPDGGDCDADELVLDIGNLPGEVKSPDDLSLLLRISGHGALTDDEVARLRADAESEGAPQRTPALQKLMDAFTDGMR